MTTTNLDRLPIDIALMIGWTCAREEFISFLCSWRNVQGRLVGTSDVNEAELFCAALDWCAERGRVSIEHYTPISGFWKVMVKGGLNVTDRNKHTALYLAMAEASR